jgi:CHAT domain-containing protein
VKLSRGRIADDWRQPESGHVQISYFLGDQRAYAWERSAAGIRVWTLPAGRAGIESRIRELQKLDARQDPQKYDAQLLSLSPLLLPAGIAGAEHTAIDIVADGPLTRVPFAGMSSPSDPSRRLIETHSVTLIASLVSVPSQPASPHRWNLVGISDSAASTSLAHAAPEVLAVAQALGAESGQSTHPDSLVLDGASATAKLLEQAMREGANVMHFATHGDADARQPLASRLTLSGEKDYLTAGQIQEWRGDVGLVFLSACDSAVGATRFGDSMPGLQRAFLRAGARHVIATLWPIEDRLAAEFARDFYRVLNTGVDPAGALARTQRDWLLSASEQSQQISMRRRIGAWAYALYSP